MILQLTVVLAVINYFLEHKKCYSRKLNLNIRVYPTAGK